MDDAGLRFDLEAVDLSTAEERVLAYCAADVEADRAQRAILSTSRQLGKRSRLAQFNSHKRSDWYAYLARIIRREQDKLVEDTLLGRPESEAVMTAAHGESPTGRASLVVPKVRLSFPHLREPDAPPWAYDRGPKRWGSSWFLGPPCDMSDETRL